VALIHRVLVNDKNAFIVGDSNQNSMSQYKLVPRFYLEEESPPLMMPVPWLLVLRESNSFRIYATLPKSDDSVCLSESTFDEFVEQIMSFYIIQPIIVSTPHDKLCIENLLGILHRCRWTKINPN
jgi:hypothetical protein